MERITTCSPGAGTTAVQPSSVSILRDGPKDTGPSDHPGSPDVSARHVITLRNSFYMAGEIFPLSGSLGYTPWVVAGIWDTSASAAMKGSRTPGSQY